MAKKIGFSVLVTRNFNNKRRNYTFIANKEKNSIVRHLISNFEEFNIEYTFKKDTLHCTMEIELKDKYKVKVLNKRIRAFRHFLDFQLLYGTFFPVVSIEHDSTWAYASEGLLMEMGVQIDRLLNQYRLDTWTSKEKRKDAWDRFNDKIKFWI